MARGGGFERPPRWAVVVVVVGVLVVTGVLTYTSVHGRTDPVSPSDIARMAAAESSAAAAEAANRPRTVLIFGDSYTAGAGATGRARRWTVLVGKAQKWVEDNFAYGSTGYLASTSGPRARAGCGSDRCPDYGQVLGGITNVAPDLILVSGGRNDVALVDASYPGRVAAFYRDLRKKFPAVRIVATSPIWDDDPAPAQLAGIGAAVRAGVRAVGGTYLDIGEPLAGHHDFVAAGGVHPNDAGHKAIAAAVDAALARAGVTP
jgi:hypothetical protein